MLSLPALVKSLSQSLFCILKGHVRVSPEPFPDWPVFLQRKSFLSLWPFCDPPLHLLHVFPVLRTLELDAVLQMESHQSRVEENWIPQPAVCTYYSFGFPYCKCTLLAHVPFYAHWYAQILSAGQIVLCHSMTDHSLILWSFSIHSSPSLYWFWGLSSPRCRTLHFS